MTSERDAAIQAVDAMYVATCNASAAKRRGGWRAWKDVERECDKELTAAIEARRDALAEIDRDHPAGGTDG